MARTHRRTWGYVGKEFLFSFFVAFLFFFFLFFLNQILVMAEQIFSKKVAFWDVARLIFYSLPVVIAFAFPFGSLVGALMAVGRLSSDNELLAFGALGVSSRQILAPLLIIGMVFSLISFIMNDYFLPLGNLRFTELYRRVLFSNPALELEPYSVKKYENTTIITGAVDGRVIRDILIIDNSPEGNRRLITARSAQLQQTQGVVSLRLDDVFVQVSYPNDGDRYDYTVSSSMVYSIQLKNIANASIGGLTPSTMGSADVWKQIVSKMPAQLQSIAQQKARVASTTYALAAGLRAAEMSVTESPGQLSTQRASVETLFRDAATESDKNVTDQSLQQYRVEFNRKFSMPVACLVFAFFAFPVGIRARRSGRTVGFGVGLLVAIIYWGLLIAGQTFGVRMSLSPSISMWLPDAVVFAAGAIIFAAGRRS